MGSNYRCSLWRWRRGGSWWWLRRTPEKWANRFPCRPSPNIKQFLLPPLLGSYSCLLIIWSFRIPWQIEGVRKGKLWVHASHSRIFYLPLSNILQWTPIIGLYKHCFCWQVSSHIHFFSDVTYLKEIGNSLS